MGGRLTWMESDVITLFAWLDYSVANGVDFWKLIVAHLQESRRLHTLPEYKFEVTQIRNKLIGAPRGKISNRPSAIPTPKLADILSRGSACIPNLQPEIIAKFKSEVEKFEQRYRGDTPQRSNYEGDGVSPDRLVVLTPSISVSPGTLLLLLFVEVY